MLCLRVIRCLHSESATCLNELGDGHRNYADLNAIDCNILGIIQQRIYQKKAHDVHDLRQDLIDM